ncbi:hypothetical protein [Pyrobaculum ferrireducens]
MGIVLSTSSSGKPIAMLIAWLAAPPTRLSMAAKATAQPRRGSSISDHVVGVSSVPVCVSAIFSFRRPPFQQSYIGPTFNC